MNYAMAFRRLSSASSSATDLGENDDEAEKEERRSRSSASTKSSTSSNSFISNLTPIEIDIQIAQCLKLNAENKINDKNAFQLKMIDFLVYSLKKHDPKISNLQMASACLDASGKIYGYRVDKVHSDLLKIVGGVRGEKRPHEEDEEVGQDANGNVLQQPRKKRKRKHNFVSTIEALRGILESYNPLSVVHHNIDAQTSDCLNQASLPKHANQGIALNLFNDVLLDRLPINRYDATNFLVPRLKDFLNGQLCQSYNAFKFLGWSIEDEAMDTSEADENDGDGEFHYNLDEPVDEDDKPNGIMDYRDDQDERFNRIANQNQQPLNDFQEIIENNPNPDANYEYSYLQGNYSIHLVKPSHWKVHIKKDVRYNGLDRSPKKVRRKKDIELALTVDTKEEAETRFVTANNKSIRLLRATYINWCENNLKLPNFIQYDNHRFYSYFTNERQTSELNPHGKVENKVEKARDSDTSEYNDMFDLSNIGNDFQNNENVDLHLDEQENQIPDNSFMFPDSEPPSQPPFLEAFLGDNLVSLPKLTNNIFIPYSQRAKKIDMRQLKKSIRKVLENQDTKEFSQLYRVLPAILTKVNAQSLSPGLAFTSLLHVAHEQPLVLTSHSNYADVTITNCQKAQQHE